MLNEGKRFYRIRSNFKLIFILELKWKSLEWSPFAIFILLYSWKVNKPVSRLLFVASFSMELNCGDYFMIHAILVFENDTTWKLQMIRSKIWPGKLRSEEVCSMLRFPLKPRKQEWIPWIMKQKIAVIHKWNGLLLLTWQTHHFILLNVLLCLLWMTDA